MTNAPKNGTAPEPDPDFNSVSGRASYRKSIAPDGSNALASPPLEWRERIGTGGADP